MSRNIGGTECDACGYRVIITGPVRAATEDDVGRYRSWLGMMIADAECALCGAKYIAWCDDRTARLFTHTYEFPDTLNSLWGAGRPVTERYALSWDLDDELAREDGSEPDIHFFDLSYRSTFDDEPGAEDRGMPRAEIERVVQEYRARQEGE